MKDYFIGVRALEDKLAEVLAEKNLLHVTDHSKFPITLTVTQNQSSDAQMEIWANADGSTSSQDSVLRFIFNLDGIEIQTSSRLVISDAFMNKIKGLAKKIHAAYVHAYFASTVSILRTAKNENAADDEDVEDSAEDTAVFDDFYGDPEYGNDAEEVDDE